MEVILVRAAIAGGLTMLLVAGLAGSIMAEPAAAATPNLVSNPSFERRQGTGPWCWTVGGGRATLGLSPQRHSGRMGATVTTPPRPAGERTLALRRDAGCATPVAARHRYTVGVWYRSTRPVRLTVSVLDGTTWRTWVRGSAQPATGRWRRATLVTAAVPAGVTKLSIGLALPAGTRMYADDVSVKDAGTTPAPARSDVLFRAAFPAADRLITNEFAHWNPSHTDARHSRQWDMTSGSLFASGGWGYTGPIDGRAPDARSTRHTDSAVFRLNTRARFNDVRVATRIRIGQFTSTPRTPARAWDGVHVWLRYQTQYHLYVVSVARRDGRVVIKKKCPGGPSNDGTYHVISREVGGHPVIAGRSRTVAASVRTNANRTVTIDLDVDGRRIMSATDTGVGCPAIIAPGAVGIRADNTRFWFADFTVFSS